MVIWYYIPIKLPTYLKHNGEEAEADEPCDALPLV
jgi:hypothetical protein